MKEYLIGTAGAKSRRVSEDALRLMRDDFLPGEVEKIEAIPAKGESIDLPGQRGMPTLTVTRTA